MNHTTTKIIIIITAALAVSILVAGLVNDNSVTGFAGQSKNIQGTVIAVGVNTPRTPTTTRTSK
jgi:hypothetical protein